MDKLGYKPVWTKRHTKIITDFMKKKETGKCVFYSYSKDIDEFFDHLHDKGNVNEIYCTYDEKGNKTIHCRREPTIP